MTLDFGRNVSGVLEIEFGESSPAAEVAVRPAERRVYLDQSEPARTEPRAGDTWKSAVGAQRWIRVELTRPGRVELTAVRLRYTPYRPGRRYPGWFLSSDRELNRIWFASSYTQQLNHLRSPEVILDGAKRDRLVWSGDLVVAGPTELLTTGRARAVRNSLALLAARQRSDGYVPANSHPRGESQPFQDLSFPGYVALWLVARADYAMRTGDTRFGRRAASRALAWLRARADSSGLLPLRDGDLTWHPPDTPTGLLAEVNAAYYGALVAAGRSREAGRVRRAFLARFALPGGLLAFSDSVRAPAHDASAAAVFFGLAPRPRRTLAALRESLWTALGPVTIGSEEEGMDRFVSPFIASLELVGRGRYGDVYGGVELLRRTWGHFLRSDPGGTDWERLGLDGEPEPYGDDPNTRGFTSLAHAWSTGPVRFLTEYVLGVRPLEPGYRRYVVAPQPAGLRWARGRVPTPRGPIDVWWRRGGQLHVRGPSGAVVRERNFSRVIHGKVAPRGGGRG